MSFGAYTRDRESDEYSAPGEVDANTGTPTQWEDTSKSSDISTVFNQGYDPYFDPNAKTIYEDYFGTP